MGPSNVRAGILFACSVAIAVPARAQVAPARSILEIRPEFVSFAAPAPAPARREMPSQMKWGMLIGGVTGAAVGAIVVSSKPCENQGWACLLRPMLVLGAAAGGGLVGMIVGGEIGKSIADHAEFDVASRSVGVKLALRTPR